MLEMAINNVEMGSELDRVHILTCCECQIIGSLLAIYTLSNIFFSI